MALALTWNDNRLGSGKTAQAGTGLTLRVTPRLGSRNDPPEYEVYVGQQRLKKNAATMEEGQIRAERLARRIVLEAAAALGLLPAKDPK